MYIKIGDIILNRDAIAYIELNAKEKMYSGKLKEGVRITMLTHRPSEAGETQSEKIFFEDEDAEAIRWYFNREESDSVVTNAKTLFNAELRSIEESRELNKKIWL